MNVYVYVNVYWTFRQTLKSIMEQNMWNISKLPQHWPLDLIISEPSAWDRLPAISQQTVRAQAGSSWGR